MTAIEEHAVSSALLASPSKSATALTTAPERRRGRPLLMSREAVLDRIRQLGARSDGLFRVHHRHPDLYARSRRLFGSWARAVAQAGLDYPFAIESARQRSLKSRRARPRRRSRALA